MTARVIEPGLLALFRIFVALEILLLLVRVIAKEEGVSEIEAGRRTLERLDRLAAARRDMAFETTLSSRTLLPRIKAMQSAGYQCHLMFCWLPNADMAVMRVARRVAAGGHSIPEDVIRRRYERGLENLFRDYLGIADSWRVVDNTAWRSQKRCAATRPAASRS